MAKKLYPYNVLSATKICVRCGKRLKKRIEVEKPRFDQCYRCYKGLPKKKE